MGVLPLALHHLKVYSVYLFSNSLNTANIFDMRAHTSRRETEENCASMCHTNKAGVHVMSSHLLYTSAHFTAGVHYEQEYSENT
jgi:hypothetical protein